MKRIRYQGSTGRLQEPAKYRSAFPALRKAGSRHLHSADTPPGNAGGFTRLPSVPAIQDWRYCCTRVALSPGRPNSLIAFCQETNSSSERPYRSHAASSVRMPPSTAATTSALRRMTHRLVDGGGRSFSVNGVPSGPITNRSSGATGNVAFSAGRVTYYPLLILNKQDGLYVFEFKKRLKVLVNNACTAHVYLSGNIAHGRGGGSAGSMSGKRRPVPRDRRVSCRLYTDMHTGTSRKNFPVPIANHCG